MSASMPLPAMNTERKPDSPIRVVVVQHEILSAQALVDLLQEDGGFDVLDPCHDVAGAEVAIRYSLPDLVIADALLANELKVVLRSVCIAPAPVTIFTGPGGDLPSVAVALFAGGACLELALVRAKVEVQQRRLCHLGRRLRSPGSPDSPARRRFAVRTEDRIVFVRQDAIDWIQAAGNYVRLHVGEASYPIRQTMSRMEQLLDPDSFMRVHRNAIVNLEQVLEFHIPSSGNMFAVLRNGKQLPLSRGYQGDLRAFLCRSLGVPCGAATSGISDTQDHSRMPVRPSGDGDSLRHSVLLH